MIQDQQQNPLLPGYSFNAYLVAGTDGQRAGESL